MCPVPCAQTIGAAAVTALGTGRGAVLVDRQLRDPTARASSAFVIFERPLTPLAFASS